MAEDDFLEQYFALLEDQKSRLRRALAYKGQKPPAATKRSRQVLEQEFALAALGAKMAALSTSNRMEVRSSFIGAAYTPCTLPLSGLKPIRLRDLVLETQHRGRVLIVRAFTHPMTGSSIQSAVEDERGDVERLAIYNLLPTAAANAVIPLGAVVAIKEPYYKLTADGGSIVRVDHPTDFVRLKSGDSIIPPGLAARTTKESPSALGLKEDGNAAFQRGEFEVAAAFYSDALEASGRGDDELRQDMYRNRAGANLRLGRYELAITDALASIISAENTSDAARDANIKALYRAGKAAYEMQDFPQARQHFEQALELNGDHKEARAELSRTGKRMSEQENGDYDFCVMVKSATKQHSRLDHASFLRRTKVAPTESRGRGLLATEALKAGDIVFLEKAFHTAHRDGGAMSVLLNLNTDSISLGSHNLRLYGTIDKMIWNPSFASKYLDLYDGGKFGSEKGAKVVDGRVVVDTFRVQSIAELNGFGCPRVSSKDNGQDNGEESHHDKSTGIWLHASYANHSCLPNVTRAFIGDMMIVRAVQDIPAGGEIFMTYISQDAPFAERHKQLKNGYGFECNCALCRAEAKVPKSMAQKRARLCEEIISFLTANCPSNHNLETMPAVKKARGRKLLQDVRETYPKALFERLPRMDCDDIGLWVAYSSLGRPQDNLANFLGVLRDLGYFVTVQGSRVTINRGSAIQMGNVVLAAMSAAQSAALGNESAASTLEALGKDVYTAVFGVDDGLAVEFGKGG